MISLGYDLGYYAGYMYLDPPPSPAADYVQGWLQGSSDGLAHVVPEAQFVFDMTVRLLLEQGRASCNESSHCAYRGFGGVKCAAGLWMRDDDYRTTFENRNVSDDLADAFPPGFYEKHALLLRMLQRLHDQMPRERVWTASDKAMFNDQLPTMKRGLGLK